MTANKMTPRQKWMRLQNPKSVADFELSLTLKEMKSFKAGRQWVKDWVPKRNGIATQKLIKEFGFNMAEVLNKLMIDIIKQQKEKK